MTTGTKPSIVFFQLYGMGFTMFSIAELLDRAKARAGIESDYRLAQMIGKPHATISTYRTGKALPGDEITLKLCAMSGDDPSVICAKIQAARSTNATVRALWQDVAARMSVVPASVVLSWCAAILFGALHSAPADAAAACPNSQTSIDSLYIVSSALFFLSLLRQKNAPESTVGNILRPGTRTSPA